MDRSDWTFVAIISLVIAAFVGFIWVVSQTSDYSSWITDDSTGCATIYYHDSRIFANDVEWTKTYCSKP